MILHRILLENYRGIERAEVELSPRGITVVEGPNEVGKSSLAEALRLVVDFQDSSRARDVKAVQPAGRDEGPRVEVELATGPYHLVIHKRFLKRPKTELEVRAPTPERLAGREAHERFHQILGETMDMPLFRALQVVQGVPGDLPDLKDNAALARALDAAAGGGSRPDEEGALFERAEQEFRRYWTATGQPARVQVDAQSAVAALESEVSLLEGRLRELEHAVRDHERIHSSLAALTARLPQLEGAAEQARKEEQELAALVQEVARAKEILGRLRSEEERLAEASRQRADQTRRVAHLQDQLAALAGEETRASEAVLQKAREAVTGAEEKLARLRAESARAEQHARLARMDFEAARDALDLEQLRERRDRLERVEERRREAQSLLERVRVDERALARLQAAERDVQVAEAQLEAAGVGVELRALAPVEVTLDGELRSLDAGSLHRQRVTEAATLAVPGQIEVRIEPPGRGLGELRARAEAARSARDALLQELGVADMEAALQAQLARRDAESLLKEIEPQRRADLRDLTFEGIVEKIDRLGARLSAHAAERPADPPPPPDLHAAREAREGADRMREELAQQLAREQEALDAHRRRAQELERAEQERSAQTKLLSSQLRGEREALEAARAERTDEALAEALASAVAEREQAERTLGALEARRAERNPEAVEVRAHNAAEALARARTEQRELQDRLHLIEGRLEADRESGLSEQLERKRADLEHARGELARLERRAEAAKLLFETLRNARDEARRAYVRPLAERIERLGRIVYGSTFAVEMSPDLEVATRTLDGVTLPFESLSTGAKEQLGIVVRLAVAQTVAEEGGVPVILDDTLGNTDPERLPAMSAVLRSASRACQVLVLTCTPERFRSLGDVRTVRLAGD